jgi:hypothetical protein
MFFPTSLQYVDMFLSDFHMSTHLKQCMGRDEEVKNTLKTGERFVYCRHDMESA